jgi:hypothetical protein
MDTHAPETSLPSPDDFSDILEDTIENTVPANHATTPERRARQLALARRQFADFSPSDAAEAQLAAFAIAAMMGAVDSLARAALPGVGGESTGRLRGNALAAARFYKSTLHTMRARRQQDAETALKLRAATAAAGRKPEPPAEEFEPIPHIELFHPRDRRGRTIPRWRNDLLSKKQSDATYNHHNKPAWELARAEEDAAIAEQAIIDAQGGPTEPEIDGYLPLKRPRPPLPTAATEPPTNG